MGSLALIGAGAMGEAILAGLIKAGTPAHEIGIIEKRAERSQELVARYGVRELRDLQGVSHCFLVVKPNDLQATLATYGPDLPESALVISIIAGKPTFSCTGRCRFKSVRYHHSLQDIGCECPITCT